MNIVSLEDAALLFNKWKSEGTSVSAFVAVLSVQAVLMRGRISKLEGNVLLLGFADNSGLILPLEGASFAYSEERETPKLAPEQLASIGFLSNPTFDECISVSFGGGQCLLMSNLTGELMP
jgi:hypothetical protein